MTISEKICKAVGIEPKIMLKYTICGDYYEKVFDELALCDGFKEYMNRLPSKRMEYLEQYLLYPDLTTPANFVRVLECEAENGTLWSWVNWQAIKPYSMELPSTKQEFLEQLLEFVERDSDEACSIKQALRQEFNSLIPTTKEQ